MAGALMSKRVRGARVTPAEDPGMYVVRLTPGGPYVVRVNDAGEITDYLTFELRRPMGRAILKQVKNRIDTAIKEKFNLPY